MILAVCVTNDSNAVQQNSLFVPGVDGYPCRSGWWHPLEAARALCRHPPFPLSVSAAAARDAVRFLALCVVGKHRSVTINDRCSIRGRNWFLNELLCRVQSEICLWTLCRARIWFSAECWQTWLLLLFDVWERMRKSYFTEIRSEKAYWKRSRIPLINAEKQLLKVTVGRVWAKGGG